MQTKNQVIMDFTRNRTITTVIKDKKGSIVQQDENTIDHLASSVHKEYVYVQHYKYNIDLTNKTKYLDYAKKDDGSADTTKAYIDKTDQQCFVLDCNSFLLELI